MTCIPYDEYKLKTKDYKKKAKMNVVVIEQNATIVTNSFEGMPPQVEILQMMKACRWSPNISLAAQL